MTIQEYKNIRQGVIDAGFGGDIKWSEGVKSPKTAEVLAREAIFVICNSGMKWTVARPIFDRIMPILYANPRASLAVVEANVLTVFRHKGKVGAIAEIWRNRAAYFCNFKSTADKLAFCVALPWIGEITKFHLAKNLGVDCAKPDRHLQRIARHYKYTSVDALCRALAQKSGDRIATVDVVLWRAAAIGIIKTNEL